MGGQRSEVQPTTTRVLMEAANWNGPNLQRTSQRLGAADRGLRALREGPRARDHDRRARRCPRSLMLELTGARLVDGTVDVGGPGRRPKKIRLRDEKVTRLLGTEVPLRRAGRAARAARVRRPDGGDYLDVTVPPFRRNDVTREVDLIEEVARLWGLEKLPATLPAHGVVRPPGARAAPAPPRRRRARRPRASPRRSAGASSRPRPSASCASTSPPSGCATRCPRTCR